MIPQMAFPLPAVVPQPTSVTMVPQPAPVVPRGAGKKFTPAEMAKRDEAKLVKCTWDVQKALLFKLPLNRSITMNNGMNAFYEL
ncbi:hypothetical protein COOONC_06005 [Cooperia oncophora]